MSLPQSISLSLAAGACTGKIDGATMQISQCADDPVPLEDGAVQPVVKSGRIRIILQIT